MKSKGALILAVTSLLSYILGLGRDRLLAATFGASVDVDLYNSAFIVPEFLLTFWITGALSLALIPILSGAFVEGKKAQAFHSLNALLSLLAVVVLVLEILAAIFMPQLSLLVAPGFGAAEHQTITQFARLLLISAMFFTVSGVWGSALVSQRKFIGFALSPVMYNIGIILGIALLGHTYGVIAAVYGALGGAVLHLLVRVPELWRSGYRLRWVWDLKDPGLHQTLRLTWPRMGGLLVYQGNLWLYNALASYLTAGSVAIFSFARNFQSVPVSLFGISLATAAFPLLSAQYAERQNKEFLATWAQTFSRILFFTVPSALGLMLLSRSIISTFLQAGRFTEGDARLTALALSCFAWAVVFESLVHILARTFYARKDMVTPMVVVLIATVVNVAASWWLSRLIGVAGLTLAFSLMTATQTILLLFLLKRRLGNLRPDLLLPSLAKLMVACLVMVVVIVVWKQWVGNVKIELLGGMVLGAAAFLGTAWVLRMPEIGSVRQILRARFKRATP